MTVSVFRKRGGMAVVHDAVQAMFPHLDTLIAYRLLEQWLAHSALLRSFVAAPECGRLWLGMSLSLVRPWQHRWGATAGEIARQMPGDGILGADARSTTRAITISVPARQVWPWLAQLGYGRAGWYITPSSAAWIALSDPGAFIMERRMLAGIKARAEMAVQPGLAQCQ